MTKRNKIVVVRFSEEEFAKLKTLSDSEHLPISTLIRWLLFRVQGDNHE